MYVLNTMLITSTILERSTDYSLAERSLREHIGRSEKTYYRGMKSTAGKTLSVGGWTAILTFT